MRSAERCHLKAHLWRESEQKGSTAPKKCEFGLKNTVCCAFTSSFDLLAPGLVGLSFAKTRSLIEMLSFAFNDGENGGFFAFSLPRPARAPPSPPPGQTSRPGQTAPNHFHNPKKSSRPLTSSTPPTRLKTLTQERLDQGGNEWDTVKPLAAHFRGDASHVVLVDNDAHKAADGEERNMVLVPTWDGPGSGESEHDGVLAALVEALLDPKVGLASKNEGGASASASLAVVDVRPKTAAVTARIASDAPALAVAEKAAALEAAQRAASAAAAAASAAASDAAAAVSAAASALPQPLQPSASAKRAAKRAAKEAAATAATALGETVLVLSSDDSESDDGDGSRDSDSDEDEEALASDLPPEPVLPETLAAWKTAVLATVAELTAAGAVDLPTVMAYCRHRATSGELKVLLNRKALRTALNSAVKQSKRSGEGGGGKKNKASPAAASSSSSSADAASPRPPLVLGTKPDGARGVSGKIISKCFSVNTGATRTPASFDEALEALAKVSGGKQTTPGSGGGGKGSNNRSGGAATVAEAIKAVAVASVSDLTVRCPACGEKDHPSYVARTLRDTNKNRRAHCDETRRKLTAANKSNKSNPPQNSSITALRSRSSSATSRKRRASPGIASAAPRGS